MNVAPGVKAGITQRGNFRLGLGPRAARLHVGTGSGPSFSSGIGGFQYWSRPAPTRRRTGKQRNASVTAAPPRPLSTTVKARGEAMALDLALQAGIAIGSAAFRAIGGAIDAHNERREEKAALIEALEHALVSAHRTSFPLANEPVWVQPELENRRAVRRRHRNEALAAIPRWRLAARRTAKLAAHRAADGWCEQQDARRIAGARAAHERACELWPGLMVNEPRSVLAALEDAFEDNAMPAFAVDCLRSTASVVMITGSSDTLPDDTVVRNDRGKPTFKRREDAAELHRDSLFSNALATVKEALAVAPALDSVQLVCVERREPKARKRPKLVPLCLMSVTRVELDGSRWQDAAHDIVRALSDVRYDVDDTGQRLRALDLREEPDIHVVVAEVAAALNCRC